MEKIGLCHNDGKPIIGRIEHDEAVLKLNEMVEWINAHRDWHGWQARGEHDPK